MRNFYQQYDFPKQKIPSSQKGEEWAARCCDWIIEQAIGIKEATELEKKYDVLHGIIPEEYYRKILNPYNATNEKYKRFPATMRNYDLMRGVIRRYVSEYLKNAHEFVVGANNPEVVFARDLQLRQEVNKLLEQAVIAEIQKKYAEYMQQGGDPQQFNPQEQIDIEKFTEEFNENFIDDVSAQGEAILKVIQDLTDDNLFYAEMYFNYITFGECYSYCDVNGTNLVKRVVSPRYAYPIPTNTLFREDDDMFCECRKMTYQQIMDEFDDYLNETQRKFLETYYAKTSTAVPASLMFKEFESMFPDICRKYSREERDFFSKQPRMNSDVNTELFDVWHVVWRGEVRRAIVTFVNEAGMLDQRIEPEEYKMNPDAGDMDVEYVYEPQVYECVRIGTRNDAIYPYGARAVAYNRGSKLPYNGLSELLPGFGRFSIIEIMLPYQVFYNIVAYHREMIIAKNKLNVLMIAQSLLGKVPERTLYRMIADGVLFIDDSNDVGMQRAQQVRMLQSDMGTYIKQLSELLEDTKTVAQEQVDMTRQRYGDITNSAGKGTTEEAITRGTMGSVIIEFMMDALRERDYSRDMDFSKFAWIDGLDTSYRDADGNLKYMSLDINSHTYADYVIKAKSSVKESEKLQQIKQFAFNLGQNGDAMMAIAAIAGDNVASIKKLIKRFNDEQQAHQEQMQQMEQQTKQMEQEFEIQKIQIKGEEDRKTVELEGYIKQQIELIKADANMISFNADVGDAAQKAGIARLNAERNRVEQQKVQVEHEKNVIDAVSSERDRQVKMHDIDTKLKIAKENKNRYDVPKSQRPKKK